MIIQRCLSSELLRDVKAENKIKGSVSRLTVVAEPEYRLGEVVRTEKVVKVGLVNHQSIFYCLPR